MLEPMTTTQIAVRLDRDLLTRVDDVVASGAYESRADIVRAGVQFVLELERRREIDRAYIEGYRRVPVTDEEMAWAMASLKESVEEEPW